ncbi:peptidylprolyl isomerase [Lysobacter concretionis Ko07 = DSM 16239]|jgi:peptidylprolyl isomerase|uniref:Peptidyl-prolyl cis-trans isomerase n=1 Tax=Lysobacter concretionis Ko07 = DSM 16239 TaxID=1122185 RepID=A0A0A0EQA5_9GAMM|nr:MULTISPECIES: FKBP-type peptidyl-prolyl cis-trans isomerase N-terminal domain-containing protein [Lysobacter]KGM52323.1 peptidylprolyl isomerase [Lysobacter concretionis Ko07 = DSM 16239]QOD91945.1 FKBP-type peptidyl-prolyl cis-trans isomerase [Lysobacter sp. CW239]
MKLRLIAVAVAALTLTAGQAFAQDTSSEKGKLSYALGYDLGRNAAESGEALDVATITKGLQDGYAKKDPSVPVDQLRTAVENMQKRQQAKAKAAWDSAAAENKTRSDAFIAQNKAKPGVQSLPSGVQYRVIEVGKGAKPTAASSVSLQVAGPFPWGQRPQGEAAQARDMPEIKLSEVEMPAMREALQQMPAGSKWEITLPSDKAYGADPRTGVPPNMAVQFEIKLVSVK